MAPQQVDKPSLDTQVLQMYLQNLVIGRIRIGYHNMYKEYRDTTLNGIFEAMYNEMVSRHRVRYPCIWIIKTTTIPTKLCKRDSTKQFHNSKIKFPLVFKKARPSSRKLKTTYKAKKPNFLCNSEHITNHISSTLRKRLEHNGEEMDEMIMDEPLMKGKEKVNNSPGKVSHPTKPLIVEGETGDNLLSDPPHVIDSQPQSPKLYRLVETIKNHWENQVEVEAQEEEQPFKQAKD
ncbi:hypothetical protein Fmac_011531 [Flemingia macrophylla]|uniref:Large ribosomal subunit protein eL20 domain-containing protein n=1 Tax=Flemingia macrophylla TaxID=520843 RepID=A0ABD1MPS9_9FABA